VASLRRNQYTLRTLLGVVCLAALILGYVRWMGLTGGIILLLIAVWGVIWSLLFWILKRVWLDAKNRTGEIIFTSGYFAFWCLPLLAPIVVAAFSLI
jgi:hypothetical protein